MNNFYEPYYILAQGQPDRTILFQHMRPKPKAGKRRTFSSIATTARRKEKKYTSFKSRKHLLTNLRSVRVNANTDRKRYDPNQFNEAHYIQAQGQAERIILFSAHNTHTQGWQEMMIFFHCNYCQKKSSLAQTNQ